MRRRLLPTAASLLLTVVLAGACSNQGEAQRCDPLADNNGSSDCSDGLVCTNVPNNGGYICCPADRRTATTSQCALSNSGVNGDGAPPPGDDAAADSSTDGSGDGATDGAGDSPSDAPVESASDAGGG